jgi:hypothetical protein
MGVSCVVDAVACQVGFVCERNVTNRVVLARAVESESEGILGGVVGKNVPTRTPTSI